MNLTQHTDDMPFDETSSPMSAEDAWSQTLNCVELEGHTVKQLGQINHGD